MNASPDAATVTGDGEASGDGAGAAVADVAVVGGGDSAVGGPADGINAGDGTAASDGTAPDDAGPANDGGATTDSSMGTDSWTATDASASDVPPTDVAPTDVASPDAAPPDVAPPDVAPPDVAAADTTSPAVCGDGICKAGSESAANCPADCGGATGWSVCPACTAQIDACTKGSVSCAGFAKCAAACKDLGCLSACDKTVDYATLSKYVAPLAKCLVSSGCLGPMPAGPGGGPPSCGNKACDGGETHLTCPADCTFPVATWELCQAQFCATSYDACAASQACVSVATCWNQTKSQQCLQGSGGQQLLQLINCAQKECGKVPETASCAGKCLSTPQNDAYCQCDAACKQYGDCCPDFATLCQK